MCHRFSNCLKFKKRNFWNKKTLNIKLNTQNNQITHNQIFNLKKINKLI